MTFPVKNEQVMIINRKDLTVSMLTWADQVLCATNRTRNNLNQQMRSVYGFSDQPQVGDKVINLHNEWGISSNFENPLTNGFIGTIKDMETQIWDYHRR